MTSLSSACATGSTIDATTANAPRILIDRLIENTPLVESALSGRRWPLLRPGAHFPRVRSDALENLNVHALVLAVGLRAEVLAGLRHFLSIRRDLAIQLFRDLVVLVPMDELD